MKTNKRKVLTVLLVMSLALLLSACGKKKIDLMDESLVTVKITGVDGHGTAEVSFSAGNLEDSIVDGKKDMTSYISAAKVSASVDYEIDKEENLKNGDTITLSVTWDKEVAKSHGIKFSGKDKKITVSGLKEVTTVDAFEHVSVEFSGLSGQGKGEIKNISNDSFLSSISYGIDTNYGLKNGDTVKVSAIFDQDDAIEAGYWFDTVEKEYTVEGLDTYIASFDKIDDGTLDKMKKQAQDIVEAEMANQTSFLKASNIKYEGSYFLNRKEGVVSYGSNVNEVYMIYSVDVKFNDASNKSQKYYIPVKFRDIVQYTDGTIFVDVQEARISAENFSIGFLALFYGYADTSNMFNDIIAKNKADYTYEVIGLEAFGA